MLYDVYELGRTWLEGASAAANIGAEWLLSPASPLFYTGGGEAAAAALSLFSHAATTPGKPAFGFRKVEVAGTSFPVREEVLDEQPFGNLLHFARDGAPPAPKLLVVAPMSGHYATILRDTVHRLLPAQDVYITDWKNANMVPRAAGRFDLDSYISTLIAWFRFLASGTGLHVLAVCQAAVPAYVATALLGAREPDAAPRSLTLMGGPIDTRLSRTRIDRFAQSRPLSWFADNAIFPVPEPYPGRGRPVYPGFLQLGSFLSMLLGRSFLSDWKLFVEALESSSESGAIPISFDEYRAVTDITAEFYLQTLDTIFQRQLLPHGELYHDGEHVAPAAIRKTALLAIEGAGDSMSGCGQTKAALTLATGLADEKKRYLLVPDTNHYGLFSGPRWRQTIAPTIEHFIREVA